MSPEHEEKLQNLYLEKPVYRVLPLFQLYLFAHLMICLPLMRQQSIEITAPADTDD